MLKTAYEKDPSDESLSFKIGKAYNESGTVAILRLYLKGAGNRKISSPDASLQLAKIYFKQQRFDAAADEYEKAASKSVGEAMDFYQWAVCLEKTNGNPDKIGNAYRLAVDKFGSSRSKEAIQSRLKLGQRELDKKDHQAALTQFQALASNADTGAGILMLMASAYEGLGNTMKAISALEKDIRLNPSDVEAYAHLGDLYTKDGQTEKARLTYEIWSISIPITIKFNSCSARTT